MKTLKSILTYCAILCLFLPSAWSQSDSIYDPIRVVFSKKFVAENSDSLARQMYIGDVKIVHDSTYFQCDSAITTQTQLNAYNNVSVLKADTIEAFSNTLIYNATNSIAEMLGEVVLVNGKEKLFTEKLILDLANDIARYPDTALMTSLDSKLSSKTGKYDMKAKIAYFYTDVVVIDSTFNLLTDTLVYDIVSNTASFIGPSYIQDKETKIYSESGFYNTESGEAFFEDNAKYNSPTGEATANSMQYLPDKSTIRLIGNAKVVDDNYLATADKIEYFDKDSIVILTGNAYFKDEDGEGTGDWMRLDQKSGAIQIIGNGTYNSDNNQLISDTIFYDSKSKIGSTAGNSVYADTLNNRKLFADYLKYKADGSYYAYNVVGRPYLEQVDKQDTTYLSADTLYSYKIAKDSLGIDSLDYFVGYPRVKIFGDSFQAIADSLVYILQDSTLQLFGSPMAWSDTTQFAADTILLTNDSKGIKAIDLMSKSSVITDLGDSYLDQIKGKAIHADLDSNAIKYMRVTGNAEVIYMLKDEKQRYIAANKTVCSFIEFFFENGELSDIKFHKEPVSKMVPIPKATPADLFLDDITWQGQNRPKSKEDAINLPMLAAAISDDSRPQIDKKSKEVDIFDAEIRKILDKDKPEQ